MSDIKIIKEYCTKVQKDCEGCPAYIRHNCYIKEPWLIDLRKFNAIVRKMEKGLAKYYTRLAEKKHKKVVKMGKGR